jgi:hypothetical protein
MKDISYYNFPFGQPLRKVQQKDTSKKKAFVLGVYASAVHARWTDKDGKQKVSAFAVASEPDIFRTGENAEQIISALSSTTSRPAWKFNCKVGFTSRQLDKGKITLNKPIS